MVKRYEDMTPKERAAVDAVRARRRTPEARAEQNRVRELVRAEFPPARPSPEVAAVGEALRAERRRQGLSLSEIEARSGIDRAVLSKLENGRQPNPTLGTLGRYASALGKRLIPVLEDSEPVQKQP